MKPAGPVLSALMATFRILTAATVAMSAILFMGPLVVAASAHGFPANSPMADVALALSKLRGTGANAAMVFFGIHLSLLGYLVSRSTFLPRVLGYFLMIAGIGYVANSITRSLGPGLIDPLFPFLAASWAIAEWAFTLWLLVKAVDRAKWDGLAQGSPPVAPKSTS
jgi:hypothetical protein